MTEEEVAVAVAVLLLFTQKNVGEM